MTSVIYAATRVEVPELLSVRDMMIDRYGRKFYEENASKTDARMIVKLSVKNPESSLVERYLAAIASSFDVEYVPEIASGEDEAAHATSASGNARDKKSGDSLPAFEPPSYTSVTGPSAPLPVNYQVQASNNAPPGQPTTPVPSPSASDAIPDFDDLARRFAALKNKK